MKEFEGYVVITSSEYEELNKGRIFEDRKGAFNKGEMCFYMGKEYISSCDDNNTCPTGSPSKWKEVIVED
ncbi:MAG: hypothetical protein KBS60_00145 [Phascolarctobacterium sp.]|nr:hypothetical protein [Candidatus Phascolarctobacterium caballi]